MLANAIQTKKYKGAYIHILNYWQDFVVVIFYRRKFYQFRSATDKKGEYTNEEYIIVLDSIFQDAHKFIEAIREKRSLKNKIKLFINRIYETRKRRKTGGVPQGTGQEG